MRPRGTVTRAGPAYQADAKKPAASCTTITAIERGVVPLHPAAFGVAALLVLAVVLLACTMPACRARARDPAVALRTEQV